MLNSKKNIKVLVLGLNITGLGALQALGERGVPVAGVDSKWGELGFYSRYGTKYVCKNNQLIDWLIDFSRCVREKVLLLPSSDEYLLILSRNEEKLSKFFHLPFPANDLLEKLLDKSKFYHLMSNYTDDIPKAVLLQFDKECLWEKWPAIVKPTYIHEFKKYFSNYKAWLINNKTELMEKQRILNELGLEAILQEIVDSKDDEQYSVCLYMDRKKTAHHVMVSRKCRQNPSGFGVGTYVKLCNNPSLARQAKEIMTAIGFTGIAEIEYRRSNSDGKLKLIEINPRIWGQNKLASYGGYDIIGAAYNDFMQESLSSLSTNADKWFFLFRDAIASFDYLNRKELCLKELAKSYFASDENKKRVGAIWCKSDPVPSMVLPFYLMWKLFFSSSA